MDDAFIFTHFICVLFENAIDPEVHTYLISSLEGMQFELILKVELVYGLSWAPWSPEIIDEVSAIIITHFSA